MGETLFRNGLLVLRFAVALELDKARLAKGDIRFHSHNIKTRIMGLDEDWR